MIRIKRALALLVVLAVGAGAPALGGTPVAVNARVLKIGPTSYEFQVTVAHGDVSWDHYLDKWEIVGEDGKVAGTRILYHPHIGEQHFTRSLRGVTIPVGSSSVILRVHDKVHGYGREKLLRLPTDDKPDTGWQ